MIKQLLEGRLFGHPVHPMLVHFPTALFSAGFLFDIGGLLLKEPSLFPTSLYVILLGLLFGLLAGVFGMIDYLKLAEKPRVFRKASLHAIIQFIVLMAFAVIAGIKLQVYPDFVAPSLVQIICMGILVGIMLFANYLGGELVFTYGIGVEDKAK